MMRKQALFLLLPLFFGGNLFAQLFEEAPAPKVQRIIEWSKDMKNDDKAVFKGDTYVFQKNGKLSNYKTTDWEQNVQYFYDSKGRIEKKEETDQKSIYTYRYAYKKRYYVEQWESEDFVTKTFFYVNDKKQVIERKEFQKDLEYEKPSFYLHKRTIYTYTKHDSLQGETTYRYNENDSKKIENVRTTIYSYYPDSGKLKLKQEFNRDDDLTYFYDYEYDDKGRITSIVGRTSDGEHDNLTEFLYKDEHIWQKINTSRTEDRTVSVYKNGLLIRQRFYEKKDYDGFLNTDPKTYRLTQISDFQYVYYD